MKSSGIKLKLVKIRAWDHTPLRDDITRAKHEAAAAPSVEPCDRNGFERDRNINLHIQIKIIKFWN